MNIRDFKMPKLKFNKIKMDKATEELEKIQIDYEKLAKENSKKKRNEPYEEVTNFKTIKEAFLQASSTFADRECILEKPDHKEAYKVTTYKEFRNDVLALGTAMVNKLGLRDKRVVIIASVWYYASQRND